jgi:hypothetical protein
MRRSSPENAPEFQELNEKECVFYRDRFREARYAALADAEGFGAICFALESLGLRLHGKQATLEQYRPRIATRSQKSPVLTRLAEQFPATFKPFDALFRTVQAARNDAMHTGAYARHATEAAIELCTGLEEALMSDLERIVGNLMVSSPVSVQRWQPVAHARQLMLMHSFSFLPVRLGKSWFLISELGLAKFLSVNSDTKKLRLGESIEAAKSSGMQLVKLRDADLLRVNTRIDEVLQRSKVQKGPMLWLVVDDARPEHLAGVLSPFELM